MKKYRINKKSFFQLDNELKPYYACIEFNENDVIVYVSNDINNLEFQTILKENQIAVNIFYK